MKLKPNLGLNKLSRVGGWLEQFGIKLISTQVVVEVEVGVELGNRVLHFTSKPVQAFSG